ncbi:MAG TPA: LysR substrate-binding domain-containing protein [Jatrophihabitantaceae bacterium]|jgi:DNA-binding transcriptional LysR family regulator|nr:LysR substrate-binding domain-containing protein [Jatrophihabitantaceae bacterium]
MDLPRLLDGRLKLRHLVLVDALSEHGSVVGAAAHLRVTQPALTRALRDLEEILGVDLYERGPRGVTPTIYGTAFTEHARAVLAQLTQAGRHVAELADAGLGTVTVGTHLAGSNLLLPRAIARLKAERPNVTVIIREATPESLLADLEAGRVDFVVGRLTAPPRRARRQRRLYDEPVRLVVRRKHPATRLRNATVSDLIDYPWALPGTETALRGELEQVFLRHDLPLPANRIECTSILTLRNLLAETDTVAALPMLIASGDPALTLLPVSLEPMSHTVGVTRPSERPLSPSALALLEHLDAVAAEMSSTVA